jgi:hypothetical protein
MQALGEHADADCRVYFTGGATAVLEGWCAERFRREVAAVLGPEPVKP